MISKNKIRVFLLVASLLVPGNGRALTDRFATFDLWPSVGDRYFFSVSSSQGLYQYQYSFDLANAFVAQPLDRVTPSGERLGSILDYYLGHFLSAGFGITDYLQAALTLPVFSTARFEDPALPPGSGESNVFDLGDLRFAMKWRAINAVRHRFGLAFEPFVTVPLGGDDHFLGESSVTGGMKAVGDVQISRRVRLALNLGAEFHGEKVLVNNIDFTHRFLTGLGVAVDIGRGFSFSGEAFANPSFSNFFSEKDTTPVEVLAGVQWDIGETGLKLGIGGGTCLICGAKAGVARGFFNIAYRRMNDVYILKEKQDEQWMIVTLKGGKLLDPEEIYELMEKCPIDPAKYDPARDDPRCTEIYELQEIADDCPAKEEFDPDRDNVKCLQIYYLREHDSDKDGTADFVDWCPTEAGKAEDRGCPSSAFLIVSPEQGQIITKTINFDFGKATLQSDAFPILDTLTGALHSQPAIKKLSIEGHTDDVGTDAANDALSRERAKTVYDYLVEHGINPERLSYRGFGENRPVAGNDTEEGRAKNRRVEFIIQEVGSF